MKKLVWFNISVMYSAVAAGFAVNATGTSRTVLVFLFVHGGLWAIYRALDLAQPEYTKG